jgi:NMD protein affecting ribosome stability and mRNA decay
MTAEEFFLSKLVSISLDGKNFVVIKDTEGHIVMQDSEVFNVVRGNNGRIIVNERENYNLILVDCRYIWRVLKRDYGMENSGIKKFISKMMSKHFNWKYRRPTHFIDSLLN